MGLFGKGGPPPMDQLVLEGDSAFFNVLFGGPGGKAELQDRTTVAKFLDHVQGRYECERSLSLGLVPHSLAVRGTSHRNGVIVILVEVEHGPRTMQWLRDDSPAAYGPDATYRDVHISLPWQYFFISVSPSGTLTGSSSVYFRNEPIRTLSDPLFDCHFYNCSYAPRKTGVHCWICTQYFDHAKEPDESLYDLAAATIEQFFFGGFNRSSEVHEGASFWGVNRTTIQDRRVRTIQAWHDATAENPHFATTVPWIRSPHTVQGVFDELTGSGTYHAPRTASELARVVTACTKVERAHKKGG